LNTYSYSHRNTFVAMATNTNNEAMRALGDRSRHLIDGIKEVEKLNIDTTLSNLPKYIVVGDQSAGKSSIVRALCGVALPRSLGTTTRCVYRITTSKATLGDKPWTCKISLIQEYELRGRSTWKECEPRATDFCTLYDEVELEVMLRRAQNALLNPNEDATRYVNADPTQTAAKKAIFSPNIISLEIRAPNLTELIFHDLPGCINSYDMPEAAKADIKQRQRDEKDLIEMIRKTVVRYIRDKSCSIVLACSADQDLEMSLTMRHVRDNDAEDRCIGVLTKADLVPRAKLPAILEILQGKKYRLQHGWYITRQLSQQEIDEGADDEAARNQEIGFFAREPWADNHSLEDQYGITELSGRISNNLALHILLE
jgi:energy-coupling factor transporter ATP-binding protein EcfA2